MEKPGHPEEEAKESGGRKPSALRKALAGIVGLGVLGGGAAVARHETSAPDRPTDVTAPATAPTSEVNIGTAESVTRNPEGVNSKENAALEQIAAGKPFELLANAAADIQIQTTDSDYTGYSFDQPIIQRNERGTVTGLIVALDHDPKVQGQPPTSPRLAPVDLGGLSEYGGRSGTLHFGDNTYEVTVTIKPHDSTPKGGLDPLNGPTIHEVISHSDSGFVGPDGTPLTPATYDGAGSATSVESNPDLPT